MVTIDIKTGETVQSGLTLEERVKQLEERLDLIVGRYYHDASDTVRIPLAPRHYTDPTPVPYWMMNPPSMG